MQVAEHHQRRQHLRFRCVCEHSKHKHSAGPGSIARRGVVTGGQQKLRRPRYLSMWFVNSPHLILILSLTTMLKLVIHTLHTPSVCCLWDRLCPQTSGHGQCAGQLGTALRALGSGTSSHPLRVCHDALSQSGWAGSSRPLYGPKEVRHHGDLFQ